MSERFIAHDAAFADVTGRWLRLELVAVCDAHEGPVYVAAEDSLYATSVSAPGPASVIKRIRLDGARFPVGPDRIDALTTSATMPNWHDVGSRRPPRRVRAGRP
jgi:hypothetical protein